MTSMQKEDIINFTSLTNKYLNTQDTPHNESITYKNFQQKTTYFENVKFILSTELDKN